MKSGRSNLSTTKNNNMQNAFRQPEKEQNRRRVGLRPTTTPQSLIKQTFQAA